MKREWESRMDIKDFIRNNDLKYLELYEWIYPNRFDDKWNLYIQFAQDFNQYIKQRVVADMSLLYKESLI